jgi:hypothetical protein
LRSFSVAFYVLTCAGAGILCLFLLFGTFIGHADPFAAVATQSIPPVQVPADAGVLDIKSLGAIDDGVTDDTAAIRATIQQAPQDAILYFPNGTYLISASLLWKHANGNWRAYLTFQ